VALEGPCKNLLRLQYASSFFSSYNEVSLESWRKCGFFFRDCGREDVITACGPGPNVDSMQVLALCGALRGRSYTAGPGSQRGNGLFPELITHMKSL